MGVILILDGSGRVSIVVRLLVAAILLLNVQIKEMLRCRELVITKRTTEMVSM